MSRPETAPAALAGALDRLDTAVALAEPGGWDVLFENARFAEWCPAGEAGGTLAERIPGFDAAAAGEQLAAARPYRLETEAGKGARARSLSVSLRPAAEDGAVLIVECQDVSARREVEYMLDSYSRMAEKHARELQKEKERVEKLLLNIMPRSVYEELRDFGTATPQRFESASVLMLDFVGFTSMAVSRDPGALVAELNDIFSAFDRIVELFGCERIKTIGDAYVAVSGLPEATPDHAYHIAKVALRMRRYLEKRNAGSPHQWRCRIGLATGPLIGSLVGIQKYVYDIFGPAINLAARLESFAEPMQIAVSEPTYAAIRDDFAVGELGRFEIRGFGEQAVFALDGERPRRA